MEFQLTEPVYDVVVRAKNGGGWAPSTNCKDKDKAVAMAEKLFEPGGYYKVVKTQYIDGRKDCPVEELVEFKGDEKEFYLNNRRTLPEYIHQIELNNTCSYAWAAKLRG